MAAVSLHPVASRGGEQSATVISFQMDDAAVASAAHPPVGFPQSPETPTFDDQHAAASPSLGGGSGSNTATAPHMEWGIHHKDLSAYPSLDGLCAEAPINAGAAAVAAAASTPKFSNGAPPPAIRAMSASQLASLHDEYVAMDVPHDVVFPFMHGVDGDNVAQNVFFGAPMGGHPTPNYRGLTIVRADMPTPEQNSAMQQRRRASSSASALSANVNARRSRADSLATTASSSGHSRGSGSDDDADLSGSKRGLNRLPPQFTHSASTVSIPNSMASSDLSSTTSIFSNLASEAGSAATSVSSGMCIDNDIRPRLRNHRISPAYDPQPPHSVLNSTVLPVELLNPLPVEQNADGSVTFREATFLEPKQAPGVSLRNFRIQCVKYATISDIVVYCPAGLHDGALQLAQWFRQAQEAMYAERCERGLGSLRYNVFVVTDPFVAFERSHQHLVALDSNGNTVDRVDFIEREREEMQRLTAASEIDDNVWMGCTADVPIPRGEDEPRPLNPNAFAICVEAHEAAEMPESSRLSYASHWLDSIEANALFELNNEEVARRLEETDADSSDERFQLSLGPTGWSPYSPLRKSNNRRSLPNGRGKPAPPPVVEPQIMPSPDDIIHLECASSTASLEYNGQQAGIESIVQLCGWIKRQSQPKAADSISIANSSSATRGSRSFSEGSTPNGETSQQLGRRVLIHCGDGYTESSILGLAYLMYSRDLTLPEAYLDLQLRCKRSFFVYARDLPLLKRLEVRIAKERRMVRSITEAREEREREAAAMIVSSADASPTRSSRSKHGGFSWGHSSSSTDSETKRSPLSSRRASSNRRDSSSSGDTSGNALLEQSVWARGLAAASGLVAAAQPSLKKAPSNASLSSGSMDARMRSPTPRGVRASPVQQHQSMTPVAAPDTRWFNDARFEGAFPSRILPFLYLGNLNHALNPAMLHAIGITHVVSVGETALTPPALDVTAAASDGASALSGVPTPPTAHNSLWHEERAGRISVLDLKNVSDDGIDPLRSTMRRAVEYIEDARRSGGSVLVHCRVGVSRSSTVVLAYVMAHLDINLVEAYLLVRSRRLNILIQPHLLFFWELRGWETYLMRQKAKRTAEPAGRRSENEEMLDASLIDSLSRLGASPAGSQAPSPQKITKSLPWSRRSTSASRTNAESRRRRRQECQTQSVSFATPQDDEDDEAHDLDVELGAGAGSIHPLRDIDVGSIAKMPFGSGSPSRSPAAAMRLTWGFLCREITSLNERVSSGWVRVVVARLY